MIKRFYISIYISYKQYYISLQEQKAVFRGSTARLLLEESGTDPHAGLAYGTSYLTCNPSTALLGASSSIEFISNTIWSNGNLTVGKSEEG